MKSSNIFNNYMKYKKITIPVTAVVCVCIIGGIVFAVSNNTKNTEVAADAETEQSIDEETYEYICYDTAGTYSDEVTYTAADITADGVILENATFDTLTITEDVGEGTVTLNNDTVNETLVINGGGQNSVYLNGGTYAQVISNDEDVHIIIGEATNVAELNVLDSSYVEVYGTVETANVLPTTYAGEITWQTGFETKDGAVVTALNISEDVDTETFVADTSQGEVAETTTLSKEQTAKVQSNASSVTTSVQKNTTVAQTTQNTISTNQNSNSANTGSSLSGNTSNNSSSSSNSNSTSNAGSTQKPSGSTNSNTTNTTGNNSSNNNSSNNNTGSTQKPSSSNNNNTSSNSGSSSNNTNGNSSNSNTTHEHNYKLTNTKTETITDIEAYDEENVPVYNTEDISVCNNKSCGYTTYSRTEAHEHNMYYFENYLDTSHNFTAYPAGGYKTGTKTVHHDAVTHERTTYTYTCSCGDSYALVND